MIMPSACDKSLVYRIAETTQIVNIHSCSRMGSVGQREHFFSCSFNGSFPGLCSGSRHVPAGRAMPRRRGLQAQRPAGSVLAVSNR